MKKLYFLILISSLLTLFPTVSSATNPEISKWIKNISEGEGAPAMGMDDYGPEIAVSGKVVHMLWMTNNNWETRQLQYRRSPDGGKTWEPKKLLVDASGLDDAVSYPKMYVSGNYVHIAYVVKNGLGPSDLTYLRSTDGGQNFETPKILYSVPQDMTEMRVKGDGSRITVAAVHNCHYCSDVNIIHLFNSNNNGDTFEDNLVPGNYNAYLFFTWDVAIEGNNIYLMIAEPVGVWYDGHYNLHVFNSNNSGLTFKDNIISVPAQSGFHHPLLLMDYNWGYKPKMATAANSVWVIWSGWNAENKERIFVSGSQDGGNSFSEAKEISGTLEGFQSGQESIVINGNEIYTCFLKTDSKIYVAKSHNSGATFDPAYEYTLQDDVQLRSGWGPSLLADPGNDNAYLLRTGPGYGVLTPESDYPAQAFLGNATIRDQRYVTAAFDEDGMLHIAFQGGRAWLSTGVFTDYEIYYRRVDPHFNATTTEDHSLAFKAKQNEGDGTGENRFDKMIIAPDPELKFTGQMTIELWLKPEIDREGTYITQNHKSTVGQEQVGGFILRSDRYQGLLPVTNIVTTSGLYPMSSSRKMHLNAWNHLAVTYDKDGGVQNFRLYLNGHLVASTTALGEIVSPDVMWMIGAFGNTYYGESFEGQMDELRFWNVARTQEEINKNLYTKLTGAEQGLVAYYNFDEISPEGQVSDLSGNRNTGFLIYQEESIPSTISDPEVRFSYIQTAAACYFTQETKDGEVFDWDFGDGTKSSLTNPKHTFLTPGVFEVCLTAFGPSGYDIFCDAVEVEGIEKVIPSRGGNAGTITVFIYGGGFNAQSEVFLARDGSSENAAIDVRFNSDDKTLTALFDLSGTLPGMWDVVVRNSPGEFILEKGFEIVEGGGPKPTCTLASGGGSQLVNRWKTVIINVGNTGDSDAYGVQFWMAVPVESQTEIRFLNLHVEMPEEAVAGGYTDFVTDYMGESLPVDSLFDDGLMYQLYGYYFPVIPAGYTFPVMARIKSEVVNQNFNIHTWVNDPLYVLEVTRSARYSLKRETLICQGIAFAKAVSKFVIGITPGVPCITGAAQIIFDNYQAYEPPTPSSSRLGNFEIDVKSSNWTYASAVFECATSLAPGWPILSNYDRAFKAIQYGVNLFTSTVELKQEVDDCAKGFYKIDFWSIPFAIIGSLDPNEKTGILGPSEYNYIREVSSIPYTILFENKPTASAPAQEVFVYDTLNKTFFDLTAFEFGPLGFGDVIYNPLPGLTEFAADIDLRPDKDLIVRVEAFLDTLSGTVKWAFRSLDPETMDLTEDPLGGFLPPNANSPEGQGFVSFHMKPAVGIKDGDAIENKASIVFDLNQAIVTNKHINVFDLMPPQSMCTIINESGNETPVQMEIEGSDYGSGIRWFEIWVSENDSAYKLYKIITQHTFEFISTPGSHYKLYSLAIDSVGNKEAIPAQPDIEVSIVTGINERREWKAVSIYPNPARNSIFIEFMLEESRVVNCSLYDLNGSAVQTLFDKNLHSGFHQYEMLLEIPDGFYFMKVSSGNQRSFKKVVVARQN